MTRNLQDSFRYDDFNRDFRDLDFDRGFGAFGALLIGGFAGNLLRNALFPGIDTADIPRMDTLFTDTLHIGITVFIKNENTLSLQISSCLACFIYLLFYTARCRFSWIFLSA